MSPTLALVLVLVLVFFVRCGTSVRESFTGPTIHWVDPKYPDPTGIAPANIGQETGGTLTNCVSMCNETKGVGAFKCNGYNYNPHTKQCFLWNHPVPGSSSMSTHERLLASSHLSCVAQCKKSGAPDSFCNTRACSGSG